MASKKKLLDQVIEVAAKPSKQRFITRYHATIKPNVSSILTEGITRNKPVFTSVNKSWLDDWAVNPDYENDATIRDALLELKIPKEDYKRLVVEHPNQYFERTGVYEDDVNDMFLEPVSRGGRVDVFDHIPPEFVKKVCLDKNGNNCYSPEDWLKKYGGGSND